MESPVLIEDDAEQSPIIPKKMEYPKIRSFDFSEICNDEDEFDEYGSNLTLIQSIEFPKIQP